MNGLELLATLFLSLCGALIAGMMFGLWWGLVGAALGAGIGVGWRRLFPNIRLTYFIFVLGFAMMGAMAFGAFWGPFAAIAGLFIGGGLMLGLIVGILKFFHLVFGRGRFLRKPTKED